jgi:hypothetical protein
LFFEHFVVEAAEVFVSVVLAAAVAASFFVKSFVGFALAAVVAAFVHFVALVVAQPLSAELFRSAELDFVLQSGHFAEPVVVAAVRNLQLPVALWLVAVAFAVVEPVAAVRDLQLPLVLVGAVATAAIVGYAPHQQVARVAAVASLAAPVLFVGYDLPQWSSVLAAAKILMYKGPA